MKKLQINNLTFKYAYKNIFSNLNLSFTSTWTSLVGNNGCGKTTLLKLIAKELHALSGNIEGNDLVYYCKQNTDDKPLGFDEFAYAFDQKAYMLKDLLQIQDEWFFRWENLSYGERKRVQIAIALHQDVDILLLDEPTNHLDNSSKKIVIKALESFKGIGILVSHDRQMLDFLCKNTVIIQNENVYKFNTNYTNALKELNLHVNFLKKENENINAKLKKLKNSIKIKKEQALMSKNRLSKRNIHKKDKSSKEKVNLAKLTGKDKNDAKLVSTFLKKYEILEQKLNKFDKSYKKGIDIPCEILRKEKSYNINEGFLKLTPDKTLHFPIIHINHDDKIAIIGDNGVGKSSFLRFFISQIKSKSRYFYLPQELNKEDELRLYEEVNSLSHEKRGLLFSFIRRLSSNPKNILNSKNLSQGELRKLFIAKALLENIDFMILDEPTNHMDIESIEALEKALMDFKKALMVVSHDEVFLKNLKLDVYKISKKSNNLYLNLSFRRKP